MPNGKNIFDLSQIKMQRNNASLAQIEAEMKRIDMLREAIDNKKIKVVKDDEWGKGDYTINKFSQSSAIFNAVDVLRRKMTLRADVWNKLSKDKQIPVLPQEVKFGKAVKVEDFGMNLREQKELADQR